MTELTLEAFGYRDNEAHVTRRMHKLLHEQAVAQPLPDWLRRKTPWAVVTDSGAEVTRGVDACKSTRDVDKRHLETST